MNSKVLIAYASKCGATEDTAQQIANTLRSKYGLEVDLVNLRHEAHPDFSQYGSIIVASGIRMKKWYSESMKFLENNFQGKNVALFVCSLYEGGKSETYPTAVERLEKFSKEHLNVTPIALEVFGGRMRFAGKVTADNIDKNKINTWSENLSKKITNHQLQNITAS